MLYKKRNDDSAGFASYGCCSSLVVSITLTEAHEIAKTMTDTIVIHAILGLELGLVSGLKLGLL